jgi:EmrB/QacA subfamily drug resistance transporter
MVPVMAVGTSNSPGRAVNSRAVFITVIAAVFVSNLDLFVVNVALPEIETKFHASLDSLSWVLNAYAIVFAALLVVAGRLADRNGHRAGFIIGLTVFTLGSLLCALSPGVGWLVSARVVQAVGAAVLMPTSLALLLATTPPERRAPVVRAWSAIGGVAAALGPVLGGLLVQADWRWVFLINLPIGAVAIVASTRVLPDVREEKPGRLPDIFGTVLLIVAIGSLSLGLVKAHLWGWGSTRVISSLAVFVVLGVWFFVRSARHASPVVEMSLLRVRSFSSASVAAMLFSVAFAAMILSSMLWCQNVWHYSALRAGLALAPGPLMVPLLAVGAGPIAKRVGNGPVAAAGNLIMGVGLFWWAAVIEARPHYASEMLPGMLVTGVGVGLALPTLIAAAATSLPPHRFATGSGIVNMARQIGAVLGIAILVSIVGAPHTRSAALTAFQHSWVAIGVLSLFAAAAALTVPRPAAVGGAAAPAAGAADPALSSRAGSA